MELGTATAIGAGLNLFGGLFSNVTNRLIARENLQYQREANAQNIAFQQRENEITREREDNAVQRAAADMTAAGLSKTLAAGNPASAQSMSAPQTQALHDSYKYESALQKMDVARLLQNMAVQQKELDMQQKKNDAEVGLINAQTAGVNLNNGTFMENFRNEQNLKMAQTFNFRMQSQESEARSKIYTIEGKYKAQQIEMELRRDLSQIFVNKASFEYTNKQKKALSYDIAYKIAQATKVGKETEMLIKDIALAELNLKGKEHDLEVARRFGLPVGSQPTGLLGSGVSAGVALKNLIRTKFDGSKLSLPDATWKALNGWTFDFPYYDFGSGGYAW